MSDVIIKDCGGEFYEFVRNTKEKQIAKLAQQVKGILVAEINAGQMIQDVKLAVNGITPVEHFGRLGGIVPDPQEIVDNIKKIANHE